MRYRRSTLGRLLVCVCVALTATAIAVPAGAAAPAATTPAVGGTVRHVRGLEHPVTIDVDTWGVPHIFAKTVDDAFLAQGFNAARDRLFQIDLWHRRGLGRLSEVFGPSYVEQDRAARLFLYRGDMDAEWASYGPDAKQIATRFTAGVNAYVDWVKRNPRALPPEFRMLNYLPGTWQPEDVVRIRTHALVSGATHREPDHPAPRVSSWLASPRPQSGPGRTAWRPRAVDRGDQLLEVALDHHYTLQGGCAPSPASAGGLFKGGTGRPE